MLWSPLSEKKPIFTDAKKKNSKLLLAPTLYYTWHESLLLRVMCQIINTAYEYRGILNALADCEWIIKCTLIS